MTAQGDASISISQTYKHGKAIGVLGEGIALLIKTLPSGAALNELGVLSEQTASRQQAVIDQFVALVGSRHWGQPALELVAAYLGEVN